MPNSAFSIMASNGDAVLLDTCAALFLTSAAGMEPAAEDAIRKAGLRRGVYLSAVSAWEIGLLTKPRRDGSVRLSLDESPDQ